MPNRLVRKYLSAGVIAIGCTVASCSVAVDFEDYTFTRTACTQTSECATPANPCMRVECINRGCSERIAENATCSVNGGTVCNAQGQCVGCLSDADCSRGACLESVCLCHDGVKNGDETGIDCGGACDPCGAGAPCATNADCLGGSCAMGVCEICGTTDWAQWTPGNGDYAIRTTTVRDKRTGLTWMKQSGEKKTWDEASAYCEMLTLDEGKWRLPTRVELGSIVDYEKATPPAIDTQAFPDIPPLGFWTATVNVASTDQAWFVSLETGYVDISDKSQALSVLCVR